MGRKAVLSLLRVPLGRSSFGRSSILGLAEEWQGCGSTEDTVSATMTQISGYSGQEIPGKVGRLRP
jgi:hypothetical protein